MTTYVTSVYGALIGMCALAGVFFGRYWRLSRDRFFLWFAGAFVTFGISWALLVYDDASEHTSYSYAIRLLGFLQILTAIVLKNRRSPD
jgi:hypothetical protein